jgi:hypothetical protein
MATTVDRETGVTVRVVSPEERWQTFDKAARHYLGMSGEELACWWDAGEFDDQPDDLKMMTVILLRPGAR